MSEPRVILKAGHLTKAAGRTARFVASTASVDRDGDIIEQDWDLTDFWANPQLLFGHKSDQLPIGRVTNWAVNGNASYADTEALPEGMDEFADKVWRMVDGGFLNAVSVGFLSRDPSPRFNEAGDHIGYRYRKNSLLELSIVPVPANQEAVRVARSFGCQDKQLCKLFVPQDKPVFPGVSAGLGVAQAKQFLAKYGRPV